MTGAMSCGPTVALVIPVFNEEAVIGQCLAAAISQTVSAEQIIVVDNGSTDATRAIVADLQRRHPDRGIVVLEQHRERGLIPTRNLGLDYAGADVIGRIDADSILQPQWVREVQKLFSDSAIDAATGPVTYTDLPLKDVMARADHAVRSLGARFSPTHYPFLYGSNMAIRRTAWREIRSQVCRDERDEMHEDIDLTLHLRRSGLRIGYLPTMVAGVAARCIRKPAWQYLHYVARFRRTFEAHDAHGLVLTVPAFILRVAYLPLRLLQRQQEQRGVQQVMR